jgi:DNA replication protein DnaC
MQSNIGLKETKVATEKIERLQDDIWTKEGQYQDLKYKHPLYTMYMRNALIGLKNKLSIEQEKAHTKIGGQAFNHLIEEISPEEADLNSYENFILGTDEDMNPIFVDNMNQHMALFGGSGSGKSVFLFNLMRQVLDGGGGATFIDGKGDKEMLKDFLSWAKQYDRLDDVYILDFSEKDENIKDEDTGLVKTPTTNTFNIFKAIGVQKALKVLKEVIAGKEDAGGGNSFFKEQALGIFDNCGLILKYMNSTGVNVHLGTYSETVNLKAHIIQAIPPEDASLEMELQTPNAKLVSINQLDGFEKFWIPPTYGAKEGMSYVKKILEPCEKYGYYIELDEREDSYDPLGEKPQISEQLQQQIGGYAGIELDKLSVISNTYSHIFNSTSSDINFKDAIAQGKLIYVRIPKMNVKQNASKLGSFLINAIVDAVSESLGKDVGISTDPLDMFEKERVTASPVYLLVLDELGAFVKDSIEPLEQLLSQARSVNISTIISSQEIAGLSDGGKDIFKEKIMSNTATKVFLKLDDEATKSLVPPLIDATVKELDHKGEQVDKHSKEEISTFLSKSRDGLGVISNQGFTRFLTSFHTPEAKNMLTGMDLLNK